MMMAAALAVCGAARAAAILQLRVIDGDGAVNAVGSRATRGVAVQVTDETGQPVEGAAVSFTLPPDGPSGTFGKDLRTTVVTTKADGRAEIWGMQWNKVPGPVEIRITAIKDKARAGVVCQQYLSDKVQARAGGTGTFEKTHHYRKWLVTGLLVGGGLVGGMAFARGRAAQTSGAAPAPATSIGTPSITIGHP